VAILGTSRHGKSLFINQILRALEVPDSLYNTSRRKDVWGVEEGPTATHAARHVAHMLCVEADERERDAPKSKEDREDRFNNIVRQIEVVKKVEAGRGAAMGGDIGGANIIESPSQHPRVTWGLPCGPCQGDERDEPDDDAVFNNKGFVENPPPLFKSDDACANICSMHLCK
jgi:hypothetical protein